MSDSTDCGGIVVEPHLAHAVRITLVAALGDSVRRFASLTINGVSISDDLPGPLASNNEVADAAIELWIRHGIDLGAVLHELVSLRPQYSDTISRLARKITGCDSQIGEYEVLLERLDSAEALSHSIWPGHLIDAAVEAALILGTIDGGSDELGPSSARARIRASIALETAQRRLQVLGRFGVLSIIAIVATWAGRMGMFRVAPGYSTNGLVVGGNAVGAKILTAAAVAGILALGVPAVKEWLEGVDESDEVLSNSASRNSFPPGP